MAAQTLTLKLRSRSAKTGFKHLPTSIEVPREATIEDAKIAIAKQAKISDYNRISLIDPVTSKNIKDRRSRIADNENVVSQGEFLVKDLGLQMRWRTVYFIEYLGPILFHLVIFLGRPYIYGPDADAASATDIQKILFGLIQLHFVRREIETLFVHRFAANTMPAWNIFRNSFFYWVPGGLIQAFVIYAPAGYKLFGLVPLLSPVRSGLEPLDYVGLGMFAVCSLCNISIHLHLAGLRAPGSTEKKIPNCIGSSIVTCPNYMFEVLTWVGVILISRSWATVLFICIGSLYMRLWSKEKERDLRRLFPDKYKKKRYTFLPGLS